jgi:predicted dehydrogenase
MGMRVAIVGCGMIGRKRAAALGDCRLTVCCDTDLDRAESLGVAAVTDWRVAVERVDVDLVVVATTHDLLAPIAAAAAAAGKHVLIEKPGARRAAELDAVAAAVEQSGAWCGSDSIIGIIGRFEKRGKSSRAARSAR